MSLKSQDEEFKRQLRLRLRQLRERSGRTREEIAIEAGVSVSTQKNWEDEDNTSQFNPTVMMLRAYTSACGSSIGELFEPWLRDAKTTEAKYVHRLLGRALQDSDRRKWVLAFMDMLARTDRDD